MGHQTSGNTSFPPLGSTGPLETQQDLQPSRTPWVHRQRQRLQGTISAMDGQTNWIQDMVDMTAQRLSADPEVRLSNVDVMAAAVVGRDCW